jgi:hypothetical protein
LNWNNNSKRTKNHSYLVHALKKTSNVECLVFMDLVLHFLHTFIRKNWKRYETLTLNCQLSSTRLILLSQFYSVYDWKCILTLDQCVTSDRLIISPSHCKWYWHQCFIYEFLFVAKVAIIHRKMYKKWLSSLEKFSQIWLQTKCEVQIFNPLPIIWVTHWKPNIKIRVFYFYFPHDWKPPKSLHFKFLN